MEYTVNWKMSIVADSPKEAAEKALKVQRDPESIATFFTVENHQAIYNVDLLYDVLTKVKTKKQMRKK